MLTLTLQTTNRKCTILIGQDLLQQTGLLLPFIPGKKVMIVSHPCIAKHYLAQVEKCLSGKILNVFMLPEGEEQKNLSSLTKIFDQLIDNEYDRQSTLIALGGGVIGDLTGFAAACFLRGVNFIQIPTSLLAQIDASIGGKTGVNHPKGKNLIGAFHQPEAVICDITTLTTLAAREFKAGLAEAIKYSLIYDANFFEFLETNMDDILARKKELLLTLIYNCCRIKVEIVEKDEKEQNIRALLNFGHSFGHAFETLGHYRDLLHGEAVALGIIIAARLSVMIGNLDLKNYWRIIHLLEKIGTDVNILSKFSFSEVYHVLRHDKKIKDDKINLILLESIGNAIITSKCDKAMMEEALLQKEYPHE